MKYKHLPRIQIGGHLYKIILKDAATVDDSGHNSGDSCQGNLEIRIATRLVDGTSRALSTIEETFWHETLHQIDRIYATNDEDILKEGDIERLAQGLYQIYNQLGWHVVEEATYKES